MAFGFICLSSSNNTATLNNLYLIFVFIDIVRCAARVAATSDTEKELNTDAVVLKVHEDDYTLRYVRSNLNTTEMRETLKMHLLEVLYISIIDGYLLLQMPCTHNRHARRTWTCGTLTCRAFCAIRCISAIRPPR